MMRELGIAFAGIETGDRDTFLRQAVAAMDGSVAAEDMPIGERSDLASYRRLHLATWGQVDEHRIEAFPPLSLGAEASCEAAREHLTLREKIDAIIEDIDLWRARYGGSAVVVAVAPLGATAGSFASLDAFDQALNDNDPRVTAAELFAYSALTAGFPYGAIGARTPATETAIIELAEKQKLPVSSGMRRPSASNPAILASIAVETARCLDLAARRQMAGAVDAFDALFQERPSLLAGEIEVENDNQLTLPDLDVPVAAMRQPARPRR